ncbi:lysM domain-containing GPI-anchored protein 2 [Andrographis paniculata]|uniref:lysM domain-containing GPI-anchored protein 2 n=1 Tax=Andrographis paniculata TaxID=175694 RepID=UPI0021E974E6|nr:lysM domain-containing GPI-anchored protein 2 [Andrographis paniculata]
MASSPAMFFSCTTALLFMALSSSNYLIFANAKSPFRCNSGAAACTALVGYVPPNATTLSAVQTLFSIDNLSTILGANNLPISSPSNSPVPANRSINIPFPCTCSNGTGLPSQPPIYTVVSGDGLYHIAAEVFSGLVTFQQIQAYNRLPDADNITVGQRLQIPLPCSCDEVDGNQVLHYGHVVQSGSSLEGIAQQYNTSQATLQKLNDLTDPRELVAGDVLDVPLRACSSAVKNTSQDYPLLVSNGTYLTTASDCVVCECDASISWKLQCKPSQNSSSHCIQPRCSNLILGNTTTSGCNRTTCAYAGFTNQTIQTTLDSESICPGSGNNGSSSAGSDRGGGCWRGWTEALLLIHLLLLCTCLV